MSPKDAPGAAVEREDVAAVLREGSERGGSGMICHDLPHPPITAEVDLSRLDGFMLDTVRLLGSELVALSTGDEFKAAVLLWCRSWKQHPACSLPDNDRVLSSFAGLPMAKWRKVRAMALRGFVKCSDGRLYHPVLCRDAIRADKAARQRRAAIRKRWSDAHDSDTKPDTEPVRPYYEDDTNTVPSRPVGKKDPTRKGSPLGRVSLVGSAKTGDDTGEHKPKMVGVS